ncbi:hypothetical protein F3K40_29870 [Streptomyces sp. LBUM 1478]|uniref:Uncharacterized protein n=1 Tax=Streptomyces scabiei (strain 87.22) TaxID=680198 RepID=C9YYY6_STRSW|nr:hypothetical protein [Streptomyces sp. LBUM 1484]MBP5870366.1 hypothetical protein [Streptomyces sp. LBUM 1485]MBP5879098.1 hypothetical protein [Streptomyces sp. LBUM 1477]MBP5886790.1 hypothetical protein [Streptomyces sp. LBUM 1487]MBP5890479.1 hypothetical protein [Streptomyces sp. LBUM 1481]MBP5902785.1 hypothetical protein [Streptomyces sp. LBUM 1488]MBP5909017.1 hypothetical protein [Streptomyces sp. LBUM 1478]MBP5913622.1 hypothetical protein [Streptomyces sp. LBUM 1486]MBP592060
MRTGPPSLSGTAGRLLLRYGGGSASAQLRGVARQDRSYELPVTPVSHDLIMRRYARHTGPRKGL